MAHSDSSGVMTGPPARALFGIQFGNELLQEASSGGKCPVSSVPVGGRESSEIAMQCPPDSQVAWIIPTTIYTTIAVQIT